MSEQAEKFVVAPERPKRYSMSFLRAAEGCLRRAHMERSVETSGEDAAVGTAFHEVLAAVGFACAMRGEDRPDPVEAAAIARRCLARPERPGPLPLVVWERTLALVDRWAPRAVFLPGEQVEVSYETEHAGRLLSCRIDRQVIGDHHSTRAKVVDCKTGRGTPAQDLTLQGKFYGWTILRHHPHIDEVEYSEDHVLLGVESGPWTFTRWDVPAFEEYLTAAVRRIDQAYDDGELPATPGDACSKWGGCPVATSCPVPVWARPSTAITSEREAADELALLLVEEARVGARKKAIRGWLEATGRRAVAVNGQELGFQATAGSATDWKQAAMEAGIDPAKYEKSKPPAFGRRKEVTS